MGDVGRDEYCPNFAPFFGYGGAASAMILTAYGAAYGTAKSGIGIAGISTFKPELVMRCLLPVVMAGIVAVYGLVIAVVIAGGISPDRGYSLLAGAAHLGAGLVVGFAGIAAGYAIGIVGDASVRGYAQTPKLFVGMLLMLIFAEVLGIYGLIVGLLLNTAADSSFCAK